MRLLKVGVPRDNDIAMESVCAIIIATAANSITLQMLYKYTCLSQC